MRSIALIGLPGSGKTTVGQRLAQELGLPFVDCDAEAEKHAGMSIPELFEMVGEAGFRALETEILYQNVPSACHVLATGGGVVTREQNSAALKRYFSVYLDRQPEDIMSTCDLAGRPLLEKHTLRELYEERRALYEQWADLTVEAEDLERAVAEIAAAWRERTCAF